MNPEDLPYAIEGYAEKYDETYLENPLTLSHAQFELDLVNKHHAKAEVISWCDVACGTGWHIRNSSIQKPKTGVDREPQMINHAKSLMPLGPNWVVCNASDVPDTLGCFDLVTHFWYGYIHQKTLDDVHHFFKSLIKSTAENGTLIFSICDPNYSFEKNEHQQKIVFENILNIDAIIWSYNDPITNTEYKNCIAPHPELIKEWIEPYFKEISILKYPLSEKSQEWQRYGYICHNRNKKMP